MNFGTPNASGRCFPCNFKCYFVKNCKYHIFPNWRYRQPYEDASAQAERWQQVVELFNNRFKVPFKVKIANKANYLLKDEAPNLYFTYTQLENSADEQSADLGRDELMPSLSMGEKRAMYLLYVLFDLERIRQLAIAGAGKYLIINDDVADSFDYKNKYAIIEYLDDFSRSNNIDMLILTHNFDFYRTVMSRLDIARENCYIVQKDEKELLTMTEFKYRNDFFQKVLISSIKDGKVCSDIKKKYLISSIPFYRNLFEYMIKDDDSLKLTCCLHIKSTPMDTKALKLSDIWGIIQPTFGLSDFVAKNDEAYLDAVKRTATGIKKNTADEILLENKIVLSIAIRLEAELFMEKVLTNNGVNNFESEGTQTRQWSKLVSKYLTEKQREVIDEVNLMTPESIHLNSFMYEPIIDMSNWKLIELYNNIQQIDTL